MASLKRPISPSADRDLPRPAPRHASPLLLESQLTSQLLSQKTIGDVGHGSSMNDMPGDAEGSRNGSRSLSKARSLSDTQPSLAPSPKLWETKKTTKDDTSVPSTPRRGLFPTRGLSLQMPSNSPSHSSSLSFIHRAPLSPKLDSSSTYGAPASVLPRRSRGLDFSRACTNLHHSTLAEQPSPDSSPTMFGRGMSIPRKGFSNNGLDSPSNNPGSFWSIMGTAERTGLSSSVGSVNMLDSDSGASSSDDDELMDPDEDPIVMTPQVQRAAHSAAPASATNPFGPVNVSPGGDWMGNYSPAAASLMRIQRARRLRHGRSRKSSSSGTASGSSAIPSPSPGSPPIKTIDGVGGSGYFAKELARKGVESRRESISLGTKELHLSSGGESDEGGMNGVKAAQDGPGNTSVMTPGKDEKRGVIRRPVTRRGSLLPKTKNFARIRAVLMEEATPVDTEVRREAEVIRQVRESDADLEPNYHISQPTTGNSSPSLPPTVPGLEDMPNREATGNDSSGGTSESGPPGSFSRQAMRHSGGKEFWNSFDNRVHTPPPPAFPRGESVAVSDDMALDSPALSSPPSVPLFPIQTGTHEGQSTNLLTEVPRKLKRRRDDDLEPTSLKRRAVSPGVSVHNSPILSQSPAGKDGAWWGLPKGSREPPPSGGSHGERNNNGNNGGAGTKRFGFQGMSDTNDGLMKMSIE